MIFCMSNLSFVEKKLRRSKEITDESRGGITHAYFVYLPFYLYGKKLEPNTLHM